MRRTRVSTMLKRRRWVRWWRPAVAAVAIVAVMAALVLGARERGGQPQATTVGRVSASPVVGSGPAAIPTRAVPLTVPDIRVTATGFAGGREFVLSQQADTPTLVYAMAAWCTTCVPEAKALVQLHRELGDHVTIVVLDIDPGDTEAMLQRFSEAAGGAPGIWALDKGSSVTRAYNIRSLDTTIVIAGGREVSRMIGAQSLDQLRAAVARARQAGQ